MVAAQNRLSLELVHRDAEGRRDGEPHVVVGTIARPGADDVEPATVKAQLLSPEDQRRHGGVLVSGAGHLGDVGHDGLVEDGTIVDVYRRLQLLKEARNALVVPNLDLT